MRKRADSRTSGQSLVEFALVIIILVFLMSAVVDFGLIFYARQQMVNALTEGLIYGAYQPALPNVADPQNPLSNDASIRYRIQLQGGDPATDRSPIVFVNLFDLNNDGKQDQDPDGYDAGVLKEYVTIESFQDGTSQNPQNCPKRERNCWLRISMRYDYRPIFPLAPLFGIDIFPIEVQRDQQIVRAIQ